MWIDNGYTTEHMIFRVIKHGSENALQMEVNLAGKIIEI